MRRFRPRLAVETAPDAINETIPVATDTREERSVSPEREKSAEGSLDDFDRNPFGEITDERREAARADAPWRRGASDFYALRFAERKDPQDLQHLAQREQAVLESMAVQLHTEPLLRNYDFQKKYNRGETGPAQRQAVESRLSSVVEATAREFKDVDSWVSNYLVKARTDDGRTLHEKDRGRIGGFGLSALEADDFKNARLAFSTAGLLETPRVRDAIEKKRHLLERTIESKAQKDDTREYTVLKQFESFFGEQAPEQRAA